MAEEEEKKTEKILNANFNHLSIDESYAQTYFCVWAENQFLMLAEVRFIVLTFDFFHFNQWCIWWKKIKNGLAHKQAEPVEKRTRWDRLLHSNLFLVPDKSLFKCIL